MNNKRIVIISLFIAISAILSNIKFFSTVALDSMPAFLAAMLISPIAGAIIGAFGHLLSSFTAGFPFTIPMHLFIALQMFIIVWLFGVLFKKANQFIAILVAIILNGPLATFFSSLLIVWINDSFTISGFFTLMVLPLTLVSIVNIIIAFSLQKVIKRAGIKL